MSYPGMTTDQMTPEFMQKLQAYQDQQRKMAMAQSLMGHQAQGQNSGIANAGQSIAGAIAMKNLQQQQDPENQVLQQRYGMNPSQANGVLNPSWMSKLFSMGGS